ncbi:OLC1v1020505C1 [Oldenlandia corymbosa var. corymbosa]|uniref:OLC1v1020505C1 n=1 Tax=Oldenlandia corymbosa var. corymbosa TaxID=529605 RepID=A0AAV1EGQ9_OLDCO|nr:OLC1v1020505C1 [Oldenlandia corymbosa var. corymbosa]
MECRIDIVSRELIKPSSPTPLEKKELKLSLLDQLQAPIFVPVLFFYQKQPPSSNDFHEDQTKTTLHLKKSFAESLTKFYPLAGKLNPEHHCVDCDDSGALFVEAKVDVSLSEAVQSDEMLGQYLPFEPFIKDEIEDVRVKPLLAVQITRFGCGSNAIGVCISHKVADLMSFMTFMNSWAALNRGEITRLVVSNFDVGRHVFPPVDHDVSFPLQPPNKGKGMVYKRFVFDKEKLKELKELAISSSAAKSPTRIEVVTAFLWKHFINVARAKIQGPATTMLFRISHLVNVRSKMSSLLASSPDENVFPFGNLAIGVPASFTFFRGENQEKKDYYGDLVRLTGDAIKRVNEDYILNSAIPSFKATKGTVEVVQKPAIIEKDWIFTSWCRFPFYEVDFGWGKPVSVVPGNLNGILVILTSTRNEEGIEAWIAMLEDEFALLPAEFLSLAATHLFHA